VLGVARSGRILAVLVDRRAQVQGSLDGERERAELRLDAETRGPEQGLGDPVALEVIAAGLIAEPTW